MARKQRVSRRQERKAAASAHAAERARRRMFGTVAGVVVGLGIGLAWWRSQRPPEPVLPAAPGSLDAALVTLVDEHVEKVRAEPSSVEARGTLCLVYEANHLWAEGARCFEQVAGLAPGEPLWALHHALCLRENGDLGRAVEIIRPLGNAHPGQAEIQDRVGQLLLEIGDHDGAATAYQREVTAAPNIPLGHAGLGDARLRAGAVDDAIRHLERAVELDPRYAAPRLALGLAYRAAGRMDDAERELALAQGARRANLRDSLSQRLDGYIRSSQLRQQKGRELLTAGRLDEAEALLSTLIRDEPDRLDARLLLADVHLRQGRGDDAVALLTEARALDPGHRASTRLATALLSLRRSSEALAETNRILTKAPSDVAAHGIRARALVALGRDREALSSFESALLGSSDVSLHRAHGEALQRLGRNSEARVAFAKAEGRTP
ncbi:MAG: tetratricopeptide repeat protein [Acidobacteriota bacterium]